MSEEVSLWPKVARRNEFFAKLEALIDEYPELTDSMSRQYKLDPSGPYWEAQDDEPKYDPTSPVMVTGIVLVVSTTNTEGWEDIIVTEPFRQSSFMTHGLIGEALSFTGRNQAWGY